MLHLNLPKLPSPRSKTERRKRVQEARRHLAGYTGLLAYEGTEHDNRAARLNQLLWAEAKIQKAIALETQTRMGDLYATAGTVARSYVKDPQ